MSILLAYNLDLERCPHCRIDRPNIMRKFEVDTKDSLGGRARKWGVYICLRCGGLITAAAPAISDKHPLSPWVTEIYPEPQTLDDVIPARARDYLRQAMDSLNSPAGAVMLAASAVDAMLKAKSYKEGSLYSRIDKAAKEHVITEEMATWAHQVRLDANEQRHSDETELPKQADAQRSIEFSKALAQLLFVLPARVKQGLRDAEKQ